MKKQKLTEGELRKLIRSELIVKEQTKRNKDWTSIILASVIILLVASIIYLGWAVQNGKFESKTMEIYPTVEYKTTVVTANESCLMFRNAKNPKDFEVVCQ